MTTIAFLAFLIAWIVSIVLLIRFISAIKRSNRLNRKDQEALSLLVLSGGGGGQRELTALRFILSREYELLCDPAVTKAGDRARVSWFITFSLFFVTGILLMILQEGASF